MQEADQPGEPVRVAVAGAAGRMGRTLVSMCASDPGLVLAAALEHAESPHLGADPGLLAGVEASGLEIGADAASAAAACDVLVDFTLPESTLRHVEVWPLSALATATSASADGSPTMAMVSW